jgi:hypothetical protein
MLYAQLIRYAQSRPTSFSVSTKPSPAQYMDSMPRTWLLVISHVLRYSPREGIFLSGMIAFKRHFLSAAVYRGSQRCYNLQANKAYLVSAHDTFPPRTPGRDLERSAVVHPRVVGTSPWRKSVSLPNAIPSMTPPPSKPIYVVE